VEVPAAYVTSCAFGGADLTDLYITTAAWELTPEQEQRQPHAGGLFRIRPGVAGVPLTPFAG
jgi:sugar lactone lactonase YvrE